MLANLLNDIRYSLHGFALRPMFAAVVVLTLALGISVNVAVFSLLDRRRASTPSSPCVPSNRQGAASI